MPKKRSKISIQMEELENRKKENDELLQEINSEIVSDEFENELDEITKNLGISDNFNEQYEKFDVFFYFTIQNKEFVYQIKSDLFNINSQCIYELIENIVKKINEKKIIINHNNIKYIVSLNDCDDDDEEENNKNFYIKNYELKHCNNKNFTPKFESESFSSKSLLNNIKSKRISFMSKNPLNIMLREKTETNKEEGDNKYQNYYDED